MPGPLVHSPEDVLARLLVTLGAGQDPDVATTAWPIYTAGEPDEPDNVITVYGTDGIKQGRLQVGGETQYRHGIQVRVRGRTQLVAHTKADAVAIILDESLYHNTVTISSDVYLVRTFSRTSGPLHIGMAVPKTRLHIYTINGTLTLRQTA